MIASRLMSLAVLAVLTFVSLAGPVSAQGSALTPELLSKILDDINREGIDRDIPAPMANALGLSATGQGWASRQCVFQESKNKIIHALSISRRNDQDIVVHLGSERFLHDYRILRDGTLLMATIYNIPTHQLTVRNRSEAQKELNTEFAFWAGTFAKDKDK